MFICTGTACYWVTAFCIWASMYLMCQSSNSRHLFWHLWLSDCMFLTEMLIWTQLSAQSGTIHLDCLRSVQESLMPVIILVLWHTFSLLVPLCCCSSTEGVHLSPQAFVSPDIIFASLFQIYPCSLTSSCLSTTVGAATDLSLSSWDGLTNTSTHSQRTQWMAS